MALTLSAITRYPVKSCRGDAPAQATVQPWGLDGDRRWMTVDDDGVQITAREHPELVLVHPQLRDDGSLLLTAPSLPDLPELHVPVPADVPRQPVEVWRDPVTALPASADAHAWFSAVLGTPARLVYLDDPMQRQTDPRFAEPGDVVSFADGYPLLVTTTASLDALNELIAAGRHAAEGPLPMRRFRPNVVIDGSAAWAEDGWRHIRIGDAQFRAVKGCPRCVLTLVDPDTARKGKEPLATLAKHRRFDRATWFGMNLIGDSPDAVISVGDEVEVLHAVPAPNGPPR